MTDFTLSDLAATIDARAHAAAEVSYTASLLQQGVGYCARKFGEEAVEAIVAAVEADSEALAAEAADVFFHLLVMLKAGNVPLAAVMDELARRAGQSGHAEKAARSPS